MATPTAAVGVSFRRVLIATDLSECSEGAVQHGLQVAGRYGSMVHFLHVARSERFATAGEFEELAKSLPEYQAGELLSNLRSKHALDGIEHRLWVLHGDVLEVVSRVVSSEQIDLLVIGTHGRSGWRKLLLGSVAEQLFRNLSCPVLTVGPGSQSAEHDPVFRHVLLATDFSPESLGALPHAVSLAGSFGARLTLLHVIENLQGEALCDRERVFAALRKQLQDVATPFKQKVQNWNCEVEPGWPAKVIVDYVHAQKVDLIVLGLKPQQTFADRLPWMHAYSIVCQANCPVLTLRAHAAA